MWDLRVFFLAAFVDIFPLGSGSVDLNIFVDTDPGSQNVADLGDPDPKHCSIHELGEGYDRKN